jgi:squalene-hopene/tetraprenyl-beta-curcumene cyclase
MKLFLLAAGLALLAPLEFCRAEPAPDLNATIAKGIAWLAQQQKPDGSFANPASDTAATEHPALTALPVLALQHDPAGAAAHTAALERAYAFLRTQAQPDGGIYQKGLSNYNTSVVLMAMLGTGNPKDEPLIERAHAFVAGQQAKDMPEPEMNGGFGYGPIGTSPSHPHPDLDNTLVALQALAAYKKARPASEHANDLDWKAAIDFVSRCQNLPASNSQPWASGDPANKGGFIYFPGVSRAPGTTLPDGKTALRSYGTMSYAGLLSFIYADLPKTDPRVTAALDWLSKNYTLEENPGLGGQGLYYYYHLAVRGLSAAEVSELHTADGHKIDWRAELGRKLVSLQKPEGFWVNDQARWMENDPVLVTSYSVLALEALAARK